MQVAEGTHSCLRVAHACALHMHALIPIWERRIKGFCHTGGRATFPKPSLSLWQPLLPAQSQLRPELEVGCLAPP